MRTGQAPAESIADLVLESVGLSDHTSLHVCASIGDEMSESFMAPRRPIGGPEPQPSQLSELFCAAKPMVAVAALALAERCRVEVEVPIGTLLGDANMAGASATLLDLLCYRSSVLGPSGMEWMCTPPPQRAAVPFFEVEGFCYSEVAAGHYLDLAWAAASGRSLSDDIEALVLDPLDITDVIIDGERAAGMDPDLVGVDLAPGENGPIPLLHVCSESFRSRTSVAFSGFSSARGWHRFFRAALDGEGPFEGCGPQILAGAGRFQSCDSSGRHDQLLSKHTGFRCGFMVAAESEGIVSPAVDDLLVTNSGVGQKVGVVLPSTGLVASVWTNASLLTSSDMLAFRDAVVSAAGVVSRSGVR